MLFRLRQHAALRAVRERLLPDGKLFAFLEDLFCRASLSEWSQLATCCDKSCGRTRKSASTGRPKVCDRGGIRPEDAPRCAGAAREANPNAEVCRSDLALPRPVQGLTIEGQPSGTSRVRRELAA